MNVGTKSILIGAHQFLIHPLFLAFAWYKLYGFPLDPRLWIAFFVHDLGYWGKPNMDGPEGELHPYLGANIMKYLFGEWWYEFTLYHSRYLSKKNGKSYSRLCVADKLVTYYVPFWLFLPLTNLTGEIKEYMEGKSCRTPAGNRTQREWFSDIQRYSKEWVDEHKDLKEDKWTGTSRDLAYEKYGYKK